MMLFYSMSCCVSGIHADIFPVMLQFRISCLNIFRHAAFYEMMLFYSTTCCVSGACSDIFPIMSLELFSQARNERENSLAHEKKCMRTVMEHCNIVWKRD